MLLLECTVVVQRCLPVEYDRSASWRVVDSNSVRWLYIYIVCTLCRCPWVLYALIVLFPVDTVAWSALATLL